MAVLNYVDMHHVALNVKKGINEQVRLIENAKEDGTSDGTFTIIRGREGVKAGPDKPRKFGPYPMKDWDTEFERLQSRGFMLSFDQPIEEVLVSNTKYKNMKNELVDELTKYLVNISKQAYEDLYSVETQRLTQIPKKNIDDARSILLDLEKNKDHYSVKEFNDGLCIIYMILPRRIDNLWKLIARTSKDFDSIILRETNAINLLEDELQKVLLKKAITDKKSTICDAYGLEIRPVTRGEREEIMDHLHGVDCGDPYDNRSRYKLAWFVRNHRTYKAMQQFVKKEGLSKDDLSLLFHGSGTENIWSILINGLILHPNAAYCGSMFGQGTYFAPSSEKSLGYSSNSGRWRSANTAMRNFLMMYDVVTGIPYDVMADWDKSGSRSTPNSPEELDALHKGAHCLWAYGRQGRLRHEEVVVYRECQSSIRYLIETT